MPVCTRRCLPDAFDTLGPDGPFAAQVPGFKPRQGQREMARKIEQVIASDSVLIAESGTGTGKTLAYVVPALLSGRKVIISTGTRNLQDQLFHRDIAQARRLLGRSVQCAMLKGRENYLCLHRLKQATAANDSSRARELQLLKDWAAATRSGDRAESSDVAEDSPVWMDVTSNADNCLGGECPDYERCFVNQARREALDADVLVVNHYLFFADLNLRMEGFAQLLPGADAVIFDEAHRLPETASDYFGSLISGNQIAELCHDTRDEELKERSGVEGLLLQGRRLEKLVRDMRLIFREKPGRFSWQACTGSEAFNDLLEQLENELGVYAGLLKEAAPRGEGLASCWRRAEEIQARLRDIAQDDAATIRWVELTRRSFLFRMTPMEVADSVRESLVASGKALVFTSATLTVGGTFDHFQQQMGLDSAQLAQWDSPFDYQKQSMLFIPENMPDPRDRGFVEAFSKLVKSVLQVTRGRAFVLFTSYRNMHEVEARLSGQLDYPLFVQGRMSRSHLLDAFRGEPNAVLFGTSSFWEGVDVQGEALSCVIIDKLPFESPGDPVLKARCTALEKQGVNPFMQYMVPRAVIALRQGAGRLIRDNQDKGLLVLADRRLKTTRYGDVFLRSLPPMRRVDDLAPVQAWFGA